jgi:F-type H+-transporting ATPase subunit b
MDIDVTFLIQFGIYVLILGVLTPLLLKPFQRVIDERENKTDGARAEVDRLKDLAGQDKDAYEARLSDSRAAASRERDSLRTDGRNEEKRIVGAARAEVLETLNASRAEILKAETTAREELEGQRQELTDQLVEKVLGRRVA